MTNEFKDPIDSIMIETDTILTIVMEDLMDILDEKMISRDVIWVMIMTKTGVGNFKETAMGTKEIKGTIGGAVNAITETGEMGKTDH